MMPVPEDFNPFEFLQSTFRRVFNRRVREHFKDLGGEDWDPDITTGRGALRYACTMTDDDNAAMQDMRLWLFFLILQGGQALWPPLYYLPSDSYQQSVKFSPQVTLYFQEDLDEVEDGYAPLDAQLSIRILGETSQTYNESKARILANRINSEFGGGSGYRFRKGRTKVSYRNPEQGISTSVNAFNETEGRQVIAKLLDLVNQTIDDRLLRATTTAAAPPIVPANQTIYGKTRRPPRDRPVGYVRFRFAELHLWGLINAIVLIDLTGQRPDLRD